MKKIFLLVVSMFFFTSFSLAYAESFNVAEGTFGEVPDQIFNTLNDSTLKPAGWEFSSPYANTGNTYAVNIAGLSKEQLLAYDLIFFTNHTSNTFTNEQKNMMEEWIIAGGTLWIDDCGEFDASNFFVSLSFNSYDPRSNDGNKYVYDKNYYFFNNVYDLTDEELTHLGHPGYSSTIGYNPEDGWKLLVSNRVDGVDYADMIAMDYGKGRIIATADDYGCGIYDSSNAEDIKLAYNILKWAKEDKPVETTVPEPSSLLLLLSSAGLLGGMYRLRGRK